MNFFKTKKNYFLLFFVFLLNGCSGGITSPKGIIAIEQRNLILISFLVMLIVVIPVIFMTLFFSFKYHHTSKNSQYNPNWNNSHKIELFSWGIPIILITFLAFLSWNKTHELDPRKEIKTHFNPIKIKVVSLNWKWLFIYPKQKIISINEVVFPTNVPIKFYITSKTVMNSFFIPSLGSQIYAMPGMISKLSLISNFSGINKGISSNYSGSGFSDMKFDAFSAFNLNFFNSWIYKVKKTGKNIKNLDNSFNIFYKDFKKYFVFSDFNIIKKLLD
ncbi:MAG: ubiquinol oxidase subunit II [Buchnera aphidicola (Periphyllus lyropictus)]|uniref:ubiquinol oxidase subunit II n=1 Tax=Buchnera aphidicola TaxID=9 RepID=UPI001ED3A5A9|nr:ubiquinol oxidase subunit II [Buchnera aphidicola]NIH16519.1 ubiquinol oxidase subunit II [Buchnera aphidicola (Periphyllus lyropictus)]USS94803.1 ubiquinol oxidase subunit II [Buchnera aphidicola (Periphyllus lyropictus)]